MSRVEFWVSRWQLVIVAALVVLSSSGCVGMAAQLMYLVTGNKIPAEFDGLKDKRVAVVCVSKTSAFGSGDESATLARMVAAMLRKEVKDIEVIRNSEVEDWIDNNDWDYIDYRAVGKGVNAQMLVAIDLSSITYFDGQTLYKGRADFTVTVYDMTNGGKIAWSRQAPGFSFPVQGGRPATEMPEGKFKQLFLTVLAQDIARSFYGYDKVEDLARDAMMLN